ncbi:ABC transporter substrate-binding protein [uncultured Methylobacterium sp.]|uniref:ABC transporter substrate-binding protein n=1 Tax=uncultured Methylobacterium sp. TaxID=157278 RepID=UPI00260AAA99|nr:ABC transporter substrate-binding protein [uncultured Methylobacterium sp.]
MPVRRVLSALVAAAALAAPAAAQETVTVSLFTQRTGPLAEAGTPIANGFADYFTMIDKRDGGVGGARVAVVECETGGEVQRALDCYEAAKARGAVVVNPWHADAALALLPRTGADRIPMVTTGYGVALAARGRVFPWAFAPPATVWDGLAVAVAHLAAREDSPDGLRGKTIAYIHHDSEAGRDPIAMLTELSESAGFTLRTYPLLPGAEDPWRRAKAASPDYVLLDGTAGMTGTPVEDAAAAGLPLERIIAVGWPGDDELRRAGKAAQGFREVAWHAPGDSFPAFDQIDLLVIDAGLSRTAKSDATGVLYNRGIYNAVVVSEAIRAAQRLAGRAAIDGEAMRRGLEAVRIDAVRWKELGLTGFAGPLKLGCTDHSGHLAGFVQEWTGTRWVTVSDRIAPMREQLRPLLDAAIGAYQERITAETGAPWPERREACEAGR